MNLCRGSRYAVCRFLRYLIRWAAGWHCRSLPVLTADHAVCGVEKDVLEYNPIRRHSAIGHVTPLAMLEGRQQPIFDERDRKLEEARALSARTRGARSSGESGKSRNSLSSPILTTYPVPVVAEDKALPGGTLSAAAMPLTDACAGRV